MRIIKIAAVVVGLSLSYFAQAETDQTTALTDEAITLFNGDETQLAPDEIDLYEALDERADVGPMRHGSRRIVVRLRCASRRFGITYCRVPGRIQTVRLNRRFSHSPCIAGRTFGAVRNMVWVRRGCSGVFTVMAIQPRRNDHDRDRDRDRDRRP